MPVNDVGIEIDINIKKHFIRNDEMPSPSIRRTGS